MILIYVVQHSVTLMHIFVASCKRVFTHHDLRVTFPFNANLNVAKALPVFLYGYIIFDTRLQRVWKFTSVK